jgi:parvulin-like peptidyl-prolyl isomerase
MAIGVIDSLQAEVAALRAERDQQQRDIDGVQMMLEQMTAAGQTYFEERDAARAEVAALRAALQHYRANHDAVMSTGKCGCKACEEARRALDDETPRG